MGIEDQSIQAYQSIGQPPAAPQLSSANMTGQGISGQNMMGGISGQGMLAAPFQNMASQIGQLGQLNRQGPVQAQQFLGGLLGNTNTQQVANTGFMGGMMPPQPARQMDMPQPAISRPFDFNTKPQQDMYKPQFGAMAGQLGQIADQLKRASGDGGGGQIGKFGNNMDQKSPTGGISQLGNIQQGPAQAQQFLSQLGKPNTQQSPAQAQQSPFSALMGMSFPQQSQLMGQRNFKEGGDVDSGLADIAKKLAAQGRNGDTELLHVTKDEIKGLLAAAKQQGMHMTRNPHTGIYEASWLSKAVKKVKDKVGPVFTKLRDVAQSAAVMAGNYFVPGSSILTQHLASKGSQKLLNSGLGQVMQMATGNLAGAGGGLSALKSGLSNAIKGGGSGILGGLKNLGSNVMGGIKNLGTKGANLLTSVKGGISNLVKNPMGTLKDWGSNAVNYLKEKGGDLKEAVKNKLAGLLAPKEGGEGEEGGGGGLLDRLKGMFTDPDRRNQLISGISALYGAKHQEQDPREKAGLTDLPKIQQQNYELKQVPNPNYGKPGEPFYLSQEFTPAQPASPPTAAAGGGLMNAGFAVGGMPSYAPGGNVEEYRAGGKLLDGPGDGMSDSIPAEIRGKKVQKALLADGEFVIPADVVSGLGNGSTKAGAKVLYGMMDRVRQARTGTTEQGKQINPNKVIPA